MSARIQPEHGAQRRVTRPIKQFWAELQGLVSAAARAWFAVLPQLLALTLLGWSAYYGSVLLGVQVAAWSPWLVIVALSLGVTLRLATLIVSLRVVARYLGAPEVLRALSHQDYVEDDRDQSLSRLLTITMLPFLALYASFGYINSFVQDVVMLSTQNLGGATLVAELDPTGSPITMTAVSLAIVLLFLARRGVDRISNRHDTLATGLFAVLIESAFLLLIALSGFRIAQLVTLWLQERALRQWYDTAIQALAQLVPFDLPEALAAITNFVTEVVWPVFWDVVTQPLAWLALTALVFGSRVLSLAQLWRTEPTTAPKPGRAARIQERLAKAQGLRRIALRVQDAFFGDIDDKYLPTWWALRLVLRAGWIPLGAFVISFNVLTLAGDWVQVQILRMIGGGTFSQSLEVAPLLALISDVGVLSAQLALLGATWVRILNRSNEAEGEATAVSADPRRRGARAAEFALIAALLIGFTAVSLAKPSDSVQQRQASVGAPARLAGTVVQIDAVRYGQRLRSVSGAEMARSRGAFVVVNASVYARDDGATSVGVTLENGDRVYYPGGWGMTSFTPPLGFRQSADMVFEIDPRDLNEDLAARISPRSFLRGFTDEVQVNLALPASGASLSAQVVEVDPSLHSEAP